jgi:hypothetical protein
MSRPPLLPFNFGLRDDAADALVDRVIDRVRANIAPRWSYDDVYDALDGLRAEIDQVIDAEAAAALEGALLEARLDEEVASLPPSLPPPRRGNNKS